jgi:hypothetical protein
MLQVERAVRKVARLLWLALKLVWSRVTKRIIDDSIGT